MALCSALAIRTRLSLRPARLVVAVVVVCALAGGAASGAQLNAVWIGATGDWNASANWEPATVPLNDLSNTYNVLIDDLDLLTSSVVTLNVNASVDNLMLDAGDTLVLPNIRILTLAAGPESGSFWNAGEVLLNSGGNFTDIRFDGGLITLSGGGTIRLSNNANNRLWGTNLGALLNVDNVIRGAGQIGVNATAITNQGTIIADQPTELLIDPTTTAVINSGTLGAEAGGTLRLSNGDFNNQGGDIEAGEGSLVIFSAVTISGGTLSTSGNGALRAVSTSTLDSTTSPVANTGRLEALNGVDLRIRGSLHNTGNVFLLSSGTATEFELHDGAIELSGGGAIVLGNHVSNRVIGVNGGSLINVDNTIRGAGQIGVNTMSLENRGTIIADQSVSLTIDPLVDLTNTGMLAAESGATLRLVNGVFENSTGVVEARNGSTVELSTATINGGVLQAAGTGSFLAIGAMQCNGDVSPVVLDGPLSVQTGAVITLRGAIENNLQINLNSTGVNTDLKPTDGPVTLTGPGTINLSNNTSNRITGAGGGSLINMSNTIRGSGQIGANTADVVNHGLIIADQPAMLTIDPATNAMVNTGTLRAQNAATMRLVNGTFNNSGGTIEALDGSLVEISNATFTGGEFAATGTGVMRVGPAATFDGSVLPIVNSGRIELVNNADVTFRGILVNSGVIHIASTGSFTDFEPTDSTLTISGGGQITMSNNFNNRILGVTGGSLVNVDNTISGSGQIGFNVTPIINQGSIIANQTAAITVNADNTIGLNNSGTLRATGGATLNIGDGPFTTSGSVIVDPSSIIGRTGGITQTAGDLTVDGLLSATGIIDVQGGLLVGSGSITGNVSSAGTVAPGSSAGLLSISGTYSQAASGLLDVEIAGVVPGSQHDVLAVGSAASLGGTLRVRFVDGFVPSIGQTFTVMTYPSRTGSFAAVDVPCTGVSVNVLATSVVVDVVAEVGFLGDLNCDCVVNLLDVQPFVMALLDVTAYGENYPTCAIQRADMNADIAVDARDVRSFIDLLMP